ncbi:hypothetical protein CLAFUW4_11806 [Fulvia fulva]|nr:hypothetical protein CLAFUR4_11811 [Fulvia fulva]KAK4618753.1 hypothetical protein CLAFUR0_11824 [Fulvia fulva]WPV18697.1 hypothetical protein CLAFUW4_11806 [Fulvia fulva]WPV33537.1 hypothetical protein CLAFUW7_11813 [Fulvia fulva]
MIFSILTAISLIAAAAQDRYFDRLFPTQPPPSNAHATPEPGIDAGPSTFQKLLSLDMTTHPKLHPSDCTIIIPTVDPENAGFKECLTTVLTNHPAAILIVTVGLDKQDLVERVIKEFNHGKTKIRAMQQALANKRRQVAFALPHVQTEIVVLVDDHVYWPSEKFLPTILAPFEDPKDCVYLKRHNFEIAATNAIDGGVFVLSGRTSAHRTVILQDPQFIEGLSNEMFFFGKFGPINPDDDNFITRWEVKKGWKLRIQYCDDARIETDLGNKEKWSQQCLRWVRTTWRSNSCSLFTDRVVWWRQPWCVYAVYWTSFFNFALFYDAALLLTLWKTTFGGQGWTPTVILAVWIFLSKMIKLIPHFRRCPADVLLIPWYLGFAYYHSWLKPKALFTFWDCTWGGRNIAAINAEAAKSGASPAKVRPTTPGRQSSGCHFPRTSE